MFDRIVQKSLRVPCSDGALGDGSAVARQLDVVLLSVGFKASSALMEHVSSLAPGPAMDLAVSTVAAVRELVGDHVRHNAYFINFPKDVPDTVEFWVSCMRETMVLAAPNSWDVAAGDEALRQVVLSGGVNLLHLVGYGSYQHTYEELLVAQQPLIESAGDRVTVVRLGGTLAEETIRLYLQLAESTVPLGEADLELLSELAVACADGVQPVATPARESRAVINAVRLVLDLPLVGVGTVTDVLRIAARASGGDVSLETPTKFRSFSRSERRALLSELQRVAADESKLADVGRFAEQWKRLGERLHAYDYVLRYPNATEVFKVAHGEREAPSLAARAQAAMNLGDRVAAAKYLGISSGALIRSADWLLRTASTAELPEVVEEIVAAMPRVSGRVLLSLREHLVNRETPDPGRVFVGRSKRAWVTPDTREPLASGVVETLIAALDAEIEARLPDVGDLVIDPDTLGIALPLSGKATADGFAVLPRGSRSMIEGSVLRFFVYWREARSRTDFDLSALFLDEDFNAVGQVSFTNYHLQGVVHSGDITSAPEGASEFIDIELDKLHSNVSYIIPQVNVYAGEGFDEVAESMFGFMVREPGQEGMPFEPRTVRMRSEMRGSSRVALPMVFARGESAWEAVWAHLYLKGHVSFNRVEANRLSTGLLLRSIVARRYLTLGWLLSLQVRSQRAFRVTEWREGMRFSESVTFVGREVPEGLPPGSRVFGPDRFNELIPG